MAPPTSYSFVALFAHFCSKVKTYLISFSRISVALVDLHAILYILGPPRLSEANSVEILMARGKICKPLKK
jgi:hypothetical protein